MKMLIIFCKNLRRYEEIFPMFNSMYSFIRSLKLLSSKLAKCHTDIYIISWSPLRPSPNFISPLLGAELRIRSQGGPKIKYKA